MFDTPDLLPLCIAPILAVFIGILSFGIGQLSALFVSKEFMSKSRKTFNYLTLLVSLIIIPIACVILYSLEIGARSPSPWFRPQEKQVIGNWQISSATLDTLEDWHGLTIPPHTITFNEDGTFILKNIPDFSIHPNQPMEFISTSGSWTLTQIEGTQKLEWVVIAVSEDQNNAAVFRFYFEGSLPPYTLIPLDGFYRYRFQK